MRGRKWDRKMRGEKEIGKWEEEKEIRICEEEKERERWEGEKRDRKMRGRKRCRKVRGRKRDKNIRGRKIDGIELNEFFWEYMMIWKHWRYGNVKDEKDKNVKMREGEYLCDERRDKYKTKQIQENHNIIYAYISIFYLFFNCVGFSCFVFIFHDPLWFMLIILF